MFMKGRKREIAIVIVFISLTIILHIVHYFVFHDLHHLLIYGLGDLAFLPLEVLIVTVILHRLLDWRDQKALTAKISILIGGFFSEWGICILRLFAQMDKKHLVVKSKLTLDTMITKKQFTKALKFAISYKPDLYVDKKCIKQIKSLIMTKRIYLGNLLQHPILLEHKTFTDLLIASFHLTEELSFREDIDNLPEKDIEHIAIDMERVYKLLLPEWIKYITALRYNYPHLYSLYLRLNPFEKNIDVIVNK